MKAATSGLRDNKRLFAMSNISKAYSYGAGKGVVHVLAVFLAAAQAWLLVDMFARLLNSDLSYLKLFPLWMRYAFIAVSAGWISIAIGLFAIALWMLVAFLRVAHQKVILNEDGIHLIGRQSQKDLPWRRVCVCSQHMFAIRIGGDEDGFWILRSIDGFRELKEELARRSAAARLG